MTDLTAITTPFSTLPRETQIALFEARLDGKEIEHHSHGVRWLRVYDPVWTSDATYRVRPAPVTYDSINWSHVAPQFIAMARNDDGIAYFRTMIPTLIDGYWISESGHTTSVTSQASYTRGTCDWKDSLVLRPGVTK